MNRACVVVFCTLISGGWCTQDLKFPPWFMFGAATAAYQVEGAWNASDKGKGIWDRVVHTFPEVVAGGVNGDVACDSYHLWRRDIEIAVELGLDIYRFSISWPRLLPSGFPNHISEDGKNYYNNLINGLLENGIQPLVAIFHFDLPQPLQDLGGWANPLISDWFADYARVVYSLYADRVKLWLTLNEPFGFCELGYNKMQAPYLDDTKVGKYLCNKHTMIAHAKAWRIYDEEYKPLYNGKVSLSTILNWYEPATPEDKELSDLVLEEWARYCHPIFSKEGGWPPAIEKLLAENAKKEGYPRPTLPPFTTEEIELVKGTYDFFGLNHYISRLVRKARPGEEIGIWPLYGSDVLGVVLEADPTWKPTGGDWFTLYPEGLRKQLNWLRQMYGVNEILITENGYMDDDKSLSDWGRVKLIRNNLEQILLAMFNDGVNITGYTHWSLIDNLEWFTGYSVNFGLYAVDFSDPNRTRTPRESARYYSLVTRTRTIDHPRVGLNYV